MIFDPRLPAYLTRTFGTLEDHELPERRELPAANGHAEARRTLITRPFGEGCDATLDLSGAGRRRPGRHGPAPGLYERRAVRRPACASRTHLRAIDRSPGVRQRGFFSLDADVERSDLPATEAALRELLDGIRQHGLDPVRFKRVQFAERARLAWSTQGNAALADYYWGSLADYEDGHFPNEERRLAKVSLQQANALAKRLFDGEGYLRIESRCSTTTCSTRCYSPPVSWPAACSGSACAAGAPDRATGPGGG